MIPIPKTTLKLIQLIFVIPALYLCGCSENPISPDPISTPINSPISTKVPIETTGAGETLTTHIHCPENGRIAVRIDLPVEPRYGESAPVVVVASTWFVAKYSNDMIGFHLVYNPVDIGAISVTHLWPGKTDPETGISSEGEYDFGGSNSLSALRDTIRFALGEIPNVDGKYLHELIAIHPLYDNVGLFASSHAGVVATNVMAYYGETFPGLKYFVGRENPTMAEMYALEIGHFDESRTPVYNPYYDYRGYSPTSILVDYSQLGWIQNEEYPEGRPIFVVETGQNYILDDKGPHIDGKRFFSPALTQALFVNEIFTLENWPEDLATPGMTRNFWPYRTPIDNFEAIGEKLPHLKILIPFAAADHVQAAPDKPHIRQAFDGFHKRAGLWTRLNCDLSYVQAEIHSSAVLEDGFPDNDANTEPADWFIESRDWGFAERLAGELTARTIPLAGIAEMADRVQSNNWELNLSGLIDIEDIQN